MELQKNKKWFSFYFIKNYFLFLIVAVVFFTSGFFIFNSEKVFAESGNITQLTVTTPPQSIDTNTQSSIITIQTQNVDGVLEKVSETTHLTLSSDSSTGKFYNANSGGCTTLLEEPFQLTMSSGSANKNFCYEDSTSGTYTLTISAEGKSWTTANQDIVINGDGGDDGDDDPTPISYTEIIEDISADTTWIKENSPYVINSEISVLPGVTLNISEGVVVKFGSGGSLSINGVINAQGTSVDKIYFTSLQDDEIGGDTNDDGDITYPGRGDWGYIFINSPSNESVFNNVIQKYSNDGLVIYYDSVITLDGFESDNIILMFGADGNLSSVEATGLELYSASDVSIINSMFTNYDNSAISSYESSIIDIKDSEIISGGQYAVNILGSSVAIFDNVSIELLNQNGVAVSVYGSGSGLEFDNGFVDSKYNCFEIFSGAFLDLNNSDLSCAHNGISAYLDSYVNFSGGNVSAFNDGFELYNEASVNIEKVKINYALDAGIVAFNNFNSVISVTQSEISDNEYGFIVYDTNISVHNNSIHDNFSAGVMTYLDSDIDFTSNYWGDKTGPTHSSNASGIGDTVSDHILFVPFLITDPLVEEVRNPVILIPGITGTYLYKNYGDKEEIWPNPSKMFLSGDDDYLDVLFLNYDGTESIDYPIMLGDIIRSISLPIVDDMHVFDNLINVLIQNGYVEGEDLFVFPYDWRFSTEDTAYLLNEKINDILDMTGNSKVDIIAHSMGGLVAKKHIADNGSDKVDQLIFLGTPQLGAPKAFKVLMFGDDMSYGIKITSKDNLGILNSKRVQYMSQNMPSVYELLPNEKYVTENGGYVSSKTSESLENLLGYDQTKNIMIEKGRNMLMFPFAENLHSSIDDLNLSGMKSYNFVGCGSDTIGRIELKEKLSWKKLFLEVVDDYKLRYTDGDTTVPLISADKTIGSEMYYVNNVSHGSLPASLSVINGIMSILGDTGVLFDDTLQDSDIYCGIKGDVVSVHSPVELHIYDEAGNHVGPDENGDIEYGISGVGYDVLDEVKYAFLPQGLNYRIVINAIDTGGYDFNIESQEGDNIKNSYNWTLIPLKRLDSTGEIWIGPDYSSDEYVIKMDNDGDGTVDKLYSEGYDGTEEAEQITHSDGKDRHISSGSIPSLINQIVIPRIEKTFEDQKSEIISLRYNKTQNENINNYHKDEVNDPMLKNYNTEDDNRYQALVGGPDTKINLIWPAMILLSVLLILLAKMFIKL